MKRIVSLTTLILLALVPILAGCNPQTAGAGGGANANTVQAYLGLPSGSVTNDSNPQAPIPSGSYNALNVNALTGNADLYNVATGSSTTFSGSLGDETLFPGQQSFVCDLSADLSDSAAEYDTIGAFGSQNSGNNHFFVFANSAGDRTVFIIVDRNVTLSADNACASPNGGTYSFNTLTLTKGWNELTLKYSVASNPIPIVSGKVSGGGWYFF